MADVLRSLGLREGTEHEPLGQRTSELSAATKVTQLYTHVTLEADISFSQLQGFFVQKEKNKTARSPMEHKTW